MNILRIRLRTCLQTILELQSAMRKIYRTNLAEDLCNLQKYIDLIDGMNLEEEDVVRLESLTAAFIREVEFSGGCRLVPAERLQ